MMLLDIRTELRNRGGGRREFRLQDDVQQLTGFQRLLAGVAQKLTERPQGSWSGHL